MVDSVLRELRARAHASKTPPMNLFVVVNEEEHTHMALPKKLTSEINYKRTMPSSGQKRVMNVND